MIYRQLAEEIIHLKKFYPIITITVPVQGNPAKPHYATIYSQIMSISIWKTPKFWRI